MSRSLKQQIARKPDGYLNRALVLCVFLFAWHLAAATNVSGLFPGPYSVLQSSIGIILSDTFLSTVAISTFRVAVSMFLIVFSMGSLALLSVYSDYIDILTTDIIFSLIYSIPPLLWALIVLVTLGISGFAPILIVTLVAAPHFLISIKEGTASIDQELVEVGEVFGNKELSILRHTVLPQLYPSLLAGFNSSLSAAWRTIVFAEFFTATSGIGYQVQQAFNTYNSSLLAAWALIILVILLSLNKVLKHIDKVALRKYKHEQKKKSS